MFLIARKIILLMPLFICFIAKAQINNPSKECKTTAEIGVLIDTFRGNVDYGHATITCDSCHYLRAIDSSYEIISFKMKTELITGDIKERSVMGNFFLNNGEAEGDLIFSKKGTFVYFYCIQAKQNDKIYYLNPFSIISK